MNFYVLLRTHIGIGLRVWSGQDEPQGFSLRRAHPTTLFGLLLNVHHAANPEAVAVAQKETQ